VSAAGLAPTAGTGWRRVPGVAESLERGGERKNRPAYATARWGGAAVFVALAGGLAVTIAAESRQAFAHAGLGFIWSGTWDPASNHFAAGTLLVGTAITTLVAMVIAVPVGIGMATFLSEHSPRWIATPISTAVELLAAVPSIVVGLWALMILSPVFARTVEPGLRGLPVLGALFGGPAYGPSIVLASVVLAIMALPSIVTLSRTALEGVGVADREAAMALGATSWQVSRTAVIAAARSGIAAAVTLAVGRALGESIAVAMVIGNRPAVPHSLLAPGATLGSAIVNQFAEASPGLGTSSVIGLAAVLLLLTVVVNLGGQALLRRRFAPPGGALPRGPAGRAPAGAAQHGDSGAADSGAEATAGRVTRRGSPLDAGTSLRRRRLAGTAMQALCAVAVAAGVAPLVALVYYTVERGGSALSVGFLTHAPTPPGIPGGGIGPAIAGSAKIAAGALAFAVPIGMLTALFLYERRGRLASAIRFVADVMTGVPSIIIGIFAYALLVRPMHRFSDVAASFAIAVLMVPIMIRANEEAMRTVAVDLWEAGIALGARRSRVARSVVVRSALPGIVRGNLLAFARGLGETAPLLFTAAGPTLALTLLIFSDGTQAFPAVQRTAWGAALVLLSVVLLISLATRIVTSALERRSR
jgi:phosphate transport system permease protein